MIQALIGSGISVALCSAVMLLGATGMMIWTSPRVQEGSGAIAPHRVGVFYNYFRDYDPQTGSDVAPFVNGCELEND